MKAVLGLGLATYCLAAGNAWSAPLTFNTALPVREGGYVLREQFVLMRIADDPTPARREMEVGGLVSVLGYGVTRDFTLFGALPWFDKDLNLNMAGRSISRDQQGFGDVTVFGRYTAYEFNAQGQTLRIAPFLGVKAPTGAHKAGDDLGRLPMPVQPGSGSWDVLGGAVFTYQTLDFEIDSQVNYKANTDAKGFEAGDVTRLDTSLQYRLWPQHLGAGVPAFLYGLLEVKLAHSARDRIHDVGDPNSGGTTLFVVPGLQYVTRKWILEAGVQIPVSQKLHGTALQHDYAVNAGFRVNF